MPLRRTNFGGAIGYGSFGLNVTVPNLDATADLSAEIPFIAPFLIQNPPDRPQNVAWAVYLSWRWKVTIGAYDSNFVKAYDVRRDKRQFGQVQTYRYDYLTDCTYVSFPQMLSPVFVYNFVVFADSLEDDRIPCDEPPSNAEFEVVTGGDWLTSLETPGLQLGAFMPGDRCIFTPETGIKSFNFGGAYYMSASGYTEENYESLKLPPSIVL